MAQLTFLIVAAMLLINVVIVKFAERDLVDAKLDAGQLLIHAVEQNLWHFSSQKGHTLTDLDSDTQFRKGITRLLPGAGFSDIIIVEPGGKKVFATDVGIGSQHYGFLAAREAATGGLWATRFSGTTWGVVWLAKSNVSVSAPLSMEGRLIGGITIMGSLSPIYERLRASERLILLYVLLDSLILVMVGIVLVIILATLVPLLQVTSSLG